MMLTHCAKPVEVTAIQFDGSYAVGTEIVKMFPPHQLPYVELVRDYGRNRMRLRARIGDRYFDIQETDWVVRGPLKELFVYRDNLFRELFEVLGVDP